MRDRKIIRAGNDVEEACRPFAGIGTCVEGAVVGDGIDAQPGDLAILGRGDLCRHVIVARERRGRQVLNAVFHPLHRTPGHDRRHDRADVARIGSDLVAKTAADVRRNDVDFVFGDLGNQRRNGANDMRRLECPPNRQFAFDLVERSDALAGLKRAWMNALIGDQLLDGHVCLSKGDVGCILVADLPIEDVVVMFALAVRAVRLVLDVFAQQRGVLCHRLERVDDHW